MKKFKSILFLFIAMLAVPAFTSSCRSDCRPDIGFFHLVDCDEAKEEEEQEQWMIWHLMHHANGKRRN